MTMERHIPFPPPGTGTGCFVALRKVWIQLPEASDEVKLKAPVGSESSQPAFFSQKKKKKSPSRLLFLLLLAS